MATPARLIPIGQWFFPWGGIRLWWAQMREGFIFSLPPVPNYTYTHYLSVIKTHIQFSHTISLSFLLPRKCFMLSPMHFTGLTILLLQGSAYMSPAPENVPWYSWAGWNQDPRWRTEPKEKKVEEKKTLAEDDRGDTQIYPNVPGSPGEVIRTHTLCLDPLSGTLCPEWQHLSGLQQCEVIGQTLGFFEWFCTSRPETWEQTWRKRELTETFTLMEPHGNSWGYWESLWASVTQSVMGQITHAWLPHRKAWESMGFKTPKGWDSWTNIMVLKIWRVKLLLPFGTNQEIKGWIHRSYVFLFTAFWKIEECFHHKLRN